MNLLTNSQLEAYETDGFLIVKNFCSADQVKQCRNQLNDFYDFFNLVESSDTNFDQFFAEILESETEANKFRKMYTGLIQRSTEVYARMTDQRLLAIIQELGLRKPYIAADPLFMISGGPGGQILGNITSSPAHQDWESMQASANAIVGWIPLTNYGKDGYSSITVLPGSHKFGLLTANPHEWFGTVEIDERVRKLKKITPAGEAGDLILFSSLLVHQTEETGADSKTRFTIQLRYGDIMDSMLRKNNGYFNYNHCLPIKTSREGHLMATPSSGFKYDVDSNG